MKLHHLQNLASPITVGVAVIPEPNIFITKGRAQVRTRLQTPGGARGWHETIPIVSRAIRARLPTCLRDYPLLSYVVVVHAVKDKSELYPTASKCVENGWIFRAKEVSLSMVWEYNEPRSLLVGRLNQSNLCAIYCYRVEWFFSGGVISAKVGGVI